MTKENTQRIATKLGKRSWRHEIVLVLLAIVWLMVAYSIVSIIVYAPELTESEWIACAFMATSGLFATYIGWRPLRYLRGHGFFTSGEHEKAEHIFQKLFSRNRSGSRRARKYFSYLAITRLALQDYAGVADCATEFIGRCGNNPISRKTALVYLYAALTRMGRNDEARKAAEEIEQLPSDPKLDFFYKISSAYQSILEDRPADALAQIEPLAGHEPYKSCTFYAAMAHSLNGLGRKAEAQEYLNRLKQMPKDRQDDCFRLYPALASVLSAAEGEPTSRNQA